MDLELSDEQKFLQEAAIDLLGRYKTVSAAREALNGGAMPDLWSAGVEAGWPGLLISEDNGGVGLSFFDAALVLEQCGRTLAGIPLIGHLAASILLDGANYSGIEEIAAGERRAAFVPGRPPDDQTPKWTGLPLKDIAPGDLPTVAVTGEEGVVSGSGYWVLDAEGADLIVVIAADGGSSPVAVAVESSAEGVTVEHCESIDATTSLSHVHFKSASGTVLNVDSDAIGRAWYLSQALLAAESLGCAESVLDMAVAYGKDRYTFGRALGSYQAIKHRLVEMLRLNENALSLLYFVGWAYDNEPDQLALAASAARNAGSRALDFAGLENIYVHGGIGATWEHDAHLYYRRAQLSRRLLGGEADAADRVTSELLRQAG